MLPGDAKLLNSSLLVFIFVQGESSTGKCLMNCCQRFLNFLSAGLNVCIRLNIGDEMAEFKAGLMDAGRDRRGPRQGPKPEAGSGVEKGPTSCAGSDKKGLIQKGLGVGVGSG